MNLIINNAKLEFEEKIRIEDGFLGFKSWELNEVLKEIVNIAEPFFTKVYLQAQQDLVDKIASSAHPYCECNNGLNAYELAKGLNDGTYTTKDKK